MKEGHINNWAPEVKSLLARLTKAGFTITSGSNGEGEFAFSEDKAFLNELIACDEFHLYVTARDGKKLTIYCVLGNCPGELVSDYTCHDDLDKVCEGHGLLWEGVAQPTKLYPYAKARSSYRTDNSTQAI